MTEFTDTERMDWIARRIRWNRDPCSAVGELATANFSLTWATPGDIRHGIDLAIRQERGRRQSSGVRTKARRAAQALLAFLDEADGL